MTVRSITIKCASRGAKGDRDGLGGATAMQAKSCCGGRDAGVDGRATAGSLSQKPGCEELN